MPENHPVYAVVAASDGPGSDLQHGVATQPRVKPKNAPERLYRLKAPKAKEHARQDQIIDYLRALQARGRVVWIARINSGGKLIREGGGRRFIRFYQSWLPGALPASKGVADILVMLPGGRLMALEVKQPGEKPTPEQRRFLAAVEAGGGLAAVVYGWEDVRTLLEPAHG